MPDRSPLPRAARDAILAWYDERGRSLPFRTTSDPYAILVSEAMAQQTQAARAGAAWLRFMERFPTVTALAVASPADVLRAWQGLGYNRRALNLWRAARQIVAEHGGRVPTDLRSLQALPGVGPYTARAIAAIAFSRPVGPVDTNVRRVLGRMINGDGTAIRPSEMQSLADAAVPPDRPADWTHALMDVGARLCRPRRPDCNDCPARPWCRFAIEAPVDREGKRPRNVDPVLAGTTPAAFTRTSRWLRGRIVERLRAAPDGAWTVVAGPIGEHDQAAVIAILAALAHDGLVELDLADPDTAGRRARLPIGRPAPARGVRYASATMPAQTPTPIPPSDAAGTLPADDPSIFALDLRGLRRRWAAQSARPAISAEAMTGTDLRAQALGYSQERLMEHAGTAVAAVVRALAVDLGRWGTGPIVILCGPGNNGGDGFVAARRLAQAGANVIVGKVSRDTRPRGAAAARNWDRIVGDTRIDKVHLPVARDIAIFGQGIEKAAIVVDALLGTGVRGTLREPIRSAVETIEHARGAGIPIVAVDTPTAVDLSSGEPSEPAVRADLTVTFHRPKTGLLTRRGAAWAGKVLVAPIGIPPKADRD